MSQKPKTLFIISKPDYFNLITMSAETPVTVTKTMKSVPQKYLKYMSYALHLLKKVVAPEQINDMAIELFHMNDSVEVAVKSVEDVLTNPMQTEMNELKTLKKSIGKKPKVAKVKASKPLVASIVDSASTEYVYAEDPKAEAKAAKALEKAAKDAAKAEEKAAKELEKTAKAQAKAEEKAAKDAKKAEEKAAKELAKAQAKESKPSEFIATIPSIDEAVIILTNVIQKHNITLPEKLPADYAEKSVLDAYLMAKDKPEAQLKPAEKKLIRDIIRAVEKEEKEQAKAEEKAAKEAEKAAKKKPDGASATHLITPSIPVTSVGASATHLNETPLSKAEEKALKDKKKAEEKALEKAAKEAEKAAKDALKAQEKAAKEQQAQQKKVIKSLKQGKIEVSSELAAEPSI